MRLHQVRPTEAMATGIHMAMDIMDTTDEDMAAMGTDTLQADIGCEHKR